MEITSAEAAIVGGEEVDLDVMILALPLAVAFDLYERDRVLTYTGR